MMNLPPAVLESRDAVPGILGEIIRQSPIGVAVIDHEGIFRSVNPAYCAIYGYREEELVGRSFTLVFPPAQQARILQLHQRFLDEGSELKGEWEVVRRDGARLSILSESVRIPGDDGRGQRLVYVIDTTRSKQIERELRESQRFIQSVLDSLGARVCVLDASGVVVSVNRAWRELASAGEPGFGAEGSRYLEALDAAARTPTPEPGASADFPGLLRDLLAGGREGFQLEHPCQFAAGRRWFMTRASCIPDSTPPRFVVAHDDITSLKLAEAALRESQALLLDMTASVPGALLRMVTQGPDRLRFVYLSAGIETLFGITPSQACADPLALPACVVPEDAPGYDAAVRAAVQAATLWEHEFRIQTPAGILKWISVKATPKPDPSGGLVWSGMLTDVSERQQIESVLRASEETYRTLFETVPQGIVYQDTQGRITSANPAAQRILGLTLDQMQGRESIDPRWKTIHEDGSDFPGDQHPAMRTLATGQPVHDVLMGVAVPERGYVWILVNAVPVIKDGQLTAVYASFEDITQRVLLSRELREQASTDFLTGVANRRSFMERLTAEFERIRRYPDSPGCVLALDLDFFKRINDSYGHAAGDAVLAQVAGVMRQMTRRPDVLGRTGGEEFMLLLPDTGIDEAMALAERLRERIEHTPMRFEWREIAITVSIGVSELRAIDPGPETALVRADQALYLAKQEGRNCVRMSG